MVSGFSFHAHFKASLDDAADKINPGHRLKFIKILYPSIFSIVKSDQSGCLIEINNMEYVPRRQVSDGVLNHSVMPNRLDCV